MDATSRRVCQHHLALPNSEVADCMTTAKGSLHRFKSDAAAGADDEKLGHVIPKSYFVVGPDITLQTSYSCAERLRLVEALWGSSERPADGRYCRAPLL